MEQMDLRAFEDVDNLIAELNTEFGDERAFDVDIKAPSWLSQYCGNSIG